MRELPDLLRWFALGAALIAVLSGSACGGARSTPRAPQDLEKYSETGLASWYGRPYHGRTTASGERYDMHELTAAHRTLPFGTMVRVVNLENGRKIKVRITDRGPFVEGRIIDLSRAAARRLQMVDAGVVRVKLVVVR